MNDYFLRHLPTHLTLSKRWDNLCTLLTDLNFAELKSEYLTIYTLLEDIIAALDMLPEDQLDNTDLKQIYHLLDLNSHTLQGLWPKPLSSFFLQQLRNKAFEAGLANLM